MKKLIILLLFIPLVFSCEPKVTEPKVTYPDPTNSDNWRIVYLEDVWYQPLKIQRDIYAKHFAVKVVGKDTTWAERYLELGYNIGKRMCSELQCARDDQKLLILSYIEANKEPKVIE